MRDHINPTYTRPYVPLSHLETYRLGDGEQVPTKPAPARLPLRVRLYAALWAVLVAVAVTIGVWRRVS